MPCALQESDFSVESRTNKQLLSRGVLVDLTIELRQRVVTPEERERRQDLTRFAQLAQASAAAEGRKGFQHVPPNSDRYFAIFGRYVDLLLFYKATEESIVDADHETLLALADGQKLSVKGLGLNPETVIENHGGGWTRDGAIIMF